MRWTGPSDGGRGTELLVAHCTALSWQEDPRRPPLERLQAAVGDELARLLLGALTAGSGGRRR